MKSIFIFLFFLIHVLNVPISFGFIVNPGIGEFGQILRISCDPKSETACLQICNQESYCEIKEPYCRDCAGTQNLKLKRIFDGVGTRIVTSEKSKSNEDFIQTLKNGEFISLHPYTLFNYSSIYNGEQTRAQFKYLCANLSQNSDKIGILLLSIDSKKNIVSGIIGAICPDEETNQASFYII